MTSANPTVLHGVEPRSRVAFTLQEVPRVRKETSK